VGVQAPIAGPVVDSVDPGDRIDYRFSAQAPVKFHIYYTEGITFL